MWLPFFLFTPIHVESVVWVTERKDVLFAFFWFLAMWTYVNYSKTPNVKNYLIVLVSLILGLMSKLMIMTLPFIFLLMDFWPLDRLNRLPDKRNGRKIDSTNISILNLFIEKIPFIIVIFVLCTITVLINKQDGALPSLESLPLTFRISNALVSYLKYLYKTIWPYPLCLLYPYPKTVPTWQTLCAFSLLLSVSFFAIRFRRRFPYFLLGWFWYLVTLLPVIGLVGSGPIADRYTYIPLIGIFIIVAWGIPELISDWNNKKALLAAGCLLIIPAQMYLTWHQAGLWKDNVTLFEHTLKVTEDNYIIHNNLGNYLNEQKNYDAAIKHHLESVRIKPGQHEGHYNLGRLLVKQGKIEEGIQHYKKAIRFRPNNETAHYNLANAFFKLGRMDDAVHEYLKAIRIREDYAEAHNNLGFILVKQGDIEKAIKHYKQALRIRPDYKLARNNLTSALQVGKLR